MSPRYLLWRLPTILLVAALHIGSLEANAEVILHNGTLDSTPAGFGEVNVRLTNVGDTFTREYFEFATHFFNFDPGGIDIVVDITDVVSNDTNDPWFDFHIQIGVATLLSADGITLAPEVDPVDPTGSDLTKILFTAAAGSITIADSIIERTVEGPALPPQPVTRLWIFFDDPVDPGEDFQLQYAVQSVPDPPFVDGLFTISETPTIPEPSALVLLSLGLICLLAFGRRRRRRT